MLYPNVKWTQHNADVNISRVVGDQLDENIAFADGFNSYFSFSRGKVAYSGSCIYTRTLFLWSINIV